MTFNITRLSGGQALVQGRDQFGIENKIVVDSTEWDDIKKHKQYHAATEEFDGKVNEFFADLLEAAATVQRVLDGNNEADPLDFVVFDEGVEAVAGVEPEVKRLSKDSKILRLIEEGHSDRLIWVHDDLVITEYVAPVTVPVPDDTAPVWADAESNDKG